ncbi:MAG: hypothetical protein V2A71_03895 [Candidatus Eisenbacteria bacterium]
MVVHEGSNGKGTSWVSAFLIMALCLAGCAGTDVHPEPGYHAPDYLYVSPFSCAGLVTNDVALSLHALMIEKLRRKGGFVVRDVEEFAESGKAIILKGELFKLSLRPGVDPAQAIIGACLSPLSMIGINLSGHVGQRGTMTCRMSCRMQAYEVPGHRLILSRVYHVSVSGRANEYMILVNKSDVIREAVTVLADKLVVDFTNEVGE